MANTLTTHYSLVKPEVAADAGAWGGHLNADLDAVDTQMKTNADDTAAAQATANAALPKAGGVLTGRVDLFSTQTKRSDLGTVSGSTELDLATAQVFTLTCGAVTTIFLSHVPTGTFVQAVLLKVTNGGGRLTLPGTVKWAGGTAPTFTASGVDLIALVSFDAGVSWLAAAQLDVR